MSDDAETITSLEEEVESLGEELEEEQRLSSKFKLDLHMAEVRLERVDHILYGLENASRMSTTCPRCGRRWGEWACGPLHEFANTVLEGQ